MLFLIGYFCDYMEDKQASYITADLKAGLTESPRQVSLLFLWEMML